MLLRRKMVVHNKKKKTKNLKREVFKKNFSTFIRHHHQYNEPESNKLSREY